MSGSEMDSNTDGIKRRDILGTAAAAGTAAVGFSGSASANSMITQAKVKEVTSGFQRPAAIQAAVEAHSDLLESVSAAGYLEDASAEAFDLEVHTGKIRAEQADPDRDKAVLEAARVDGEVVPRLRLLREYDDDHALNIILYPTEDAAVAGVVDGDTAERIEATGSVSAQISIDCKPSCVGVNCGSNEECELISSCCCWDYCKTATCMEANCTCTSNCGGGWF